MKNKNIDFELIKENILNELYYVTKTDLFKFTILKKYIRRKICK